MSIKMRQNCPFMWFTANEPLCLKAPSGTKIILPLTQVNLTEAVPNAGFS